MFKKIPGTDEYRINLKCEIIDPFGVKCDLSSKHKGKVEIEIFGITRQVKPEWLALLAWYECGIIKNLETYLDKIKFFPTCRDLKVKCGRIMQFTEPVYYKEGFRYIPSYPRYAIDINCNIIDTFTNERVSADYEQHGYLHAYLRSPDRGANRYIKAHRLLAFAWLPNNDFITKPIINHIDSNRSNNALKNLEWCSYSENTIHALIFGNNNTSVGMKTRDVISGTVEVYRSTAELSRKLGFSRGYSPASFMDRLPGFLYKDRYEVKRVDDESPWYYESNAYNPDKPKKQHFTIKVLNKETGELETFTNVREFYKTYKLWGALNLDAGVAEFKIKFPDYEINYQRNTVVGPYRILNLENKQIVVVKTIREASEFIGKGENELNIDLRRGWKYIYSGKWIIVPGINDFNVKEYQEKPKPFTKIVITDVRDGVETIANSIKDASRITGVMPRTIDMRLRTGKPVRCFCFRPLE